MKRGSLPRLREIAVARPIPSFPFILKCQPAQHWMRPSGTVPGLKAAAFEFVL